MALTVYGVVALTFMMSMYALERRGNGYVLALSLIHIYVEVDAGLAGSWRPLLPDGVVLDTDDVARVEVVGRRVLRRFVDVSTAGPEEVAP